MDALHAWFCFTDFPHFIHIYLLISDLLRTPEDFALIVHDFAADMARQNIRYREATFTPFTHTDLQDKGLTIDHLLAGLDEGRRTAQAEFGVEMRWVFDVHRNCPVFGRDGAYDPYPRSAPLPAAGHRPRRRRLWPGWLRGSVRRLRPSPTPLPRPKRPVCSPHPTPARQWATPAPAMP